MRSKIQSLLILLLVGVCANFYTSCDQVEFADLSGERVYLEDLSDDDVKNMFPDNPDAPGTPVTPGGDDDDKKPPAGDDPVVPVPAPEPEPDKPGKGDDKKNDDNKGDDKKPPAGDDEAKPPVVENPEDPDLPKIVEDVLIYCGKKKKKVLVCHIPPGNPANAHTICIGKPAVDHHREHHGDYLGNCGDNNDDDSDDDSDSDSDDDSDDEPADT